MTTPSPFAMKLAAIAEELLALCVGGNESDFVRHTGVG
jgi:hypothetical protein